VAWRHHGLALARERETDRDLEKEKKRERNKGRERKKRDKRGSRIGKPMLTHRGPATRMWAQAAPWGSAVANQSRLVCGNIG